MKMIFLGRGEQCHDLLEWVSHNNYEIVAAFGDKTVINSAKEMGIPIFTIQEISEKLYTDKSFADIAVSYQYYDKLNSPIIDYPQYGCINFHPAPLPDYRGRGGCSFAILERQKKWGASAHYIDKEFDTGDIIKVWTFDFDYRLETAISLKKKTLELQVQLFKSVMLDVIKKGRLEATPQNRCTGKYISKKQMLAAMKIDLTADDIDNKIQAFWYPPYTGAYLDLNGENYMLINDYIFKKYF